jgi:menaquinone-dependent protoporphyrinogen oxidase
MAALNKRQSPPKRILVVFGTTHGHTAKVATAIGKAIDRAGAQAVVADATREAAAIDVDGFDGVIVAASVHAGGYQDGVLDWVLRHARSLNAMPTAFVSVCLGVLQDDAKVDAELAQLRGRFFDKTGWTPQIVLPVAGALAYSRYNFVTRTLMKRIAAQAGGDTDTSRDYEYTDWQALAAFATSFARRLPKVARAK